MHRAQRIVRPIAAHGEEFVVPAAQARDALFVLWIRLAAQRQPAQRNEVRIDDELWRRGALGMRRGAARSRPAERIAAFDAQRIEPPAAAHARDPGERVILRAFHASDEGCDSVRYERGKVVVDFDAVTRQPTARLHAIGELHRLAYGA